MKKNVLLALFLIVWGLSSAQITEDPPINVFFISNDVETRVGDIRNYSIVTETEPNIITSWSWNVVGGTVLKQSETSIQVRWDTAGTGSITFTGQSGLTGLFGRTLVTVLSGSDTFEDCIYTISHNGQSLNGGTLRINPEAQTLQFDVNYVDPSACSDPPTLRFMPESDVSWMTVDTADPTLFRINFTANSELERSTILYGTDVVTNQIVLVANIQQLSSTCRRQSYYIDSDGDGFGDYNATPTESCAPVYGSVTNNSDLCPNQHSTTNMGCPPSLDDTMNWTTAESFDISGNKIASSKSYFDNLGKPIQSQTYDIKHQRIWASQSLYDSQGRPALQTLSAPISEQGVAEDFVYKEDFIQKSNGQLLTTSDIESASLLNPPTIGTLSNTLGWYYSNANEDEPLQDITNRPYSRTLYSELNPGAVTQVIGGNKTDTNDDGVINDNDSWRQGYSFSMPAAQEMYYAFGYDYFPKNPAVVESFLADSKQLPNQQSFPASFYYTKKVQTENECLPLSEIDWSDYTHRMNVYASFRLELGKIYKINYRNQGEAYYQIVGLGTAYGITNQDRDYGTLVAGGWDDCEELFASNSQIDNFQTVVSNTNYSVNWLKATKSVVEDVHGNESVVFTDTDGKILGAARAGVNGRTGENHQYEVLSLIGKQKYVDIHIPKGCENTAQLIGSSANYRIFNLKNEESVANLNNPGFYRVEYIGTEMLSDISALTYIHKGNGSIQPVSTTAFGVRYKVNYHDFSLNYYNETGMLIQSLQPLGFHNSELSSLTATVSHNETLASVFQYNSLGQLLYTKSPDEGEAWFKYRKDGQIRFSQNNKQQARNEFSYTNYDELGRPVESGIGRGDFNSMNPDDEQPFTTLNDFKTSTIYDTEDLSLIFLSQFFGIPEGFKQTYVAGNVSAVSNGGFYSTTWYSYDIYGRVKTLLTNTHDGFKTIDYEYDPVTGKVLQVIYQKDIPQELFVHRYTYNSVQQLEKVETSTDNVNFTLHATYDYYETGALKSTTLADGIQKIDYVYNLAGQLKAINHPNEIGGDENDLFGMVIDYHKGDYRRNNNYAMATGGTDQFNGNMKSISWNTLTSNNQGVAHYDFLYNSNNWLQQADFSSPGSQVANDYQVGIPQYDANGNIQQLIRNKQSNGSGGTSNAMDQLTYHYNPNKPNQLDYVQDDVMTETGANDIKNQPQHNYVYNEIGQLELSVEDEIMYNYTPSGLVDYVSIFTKNFVHGIRSGLRTLYSDRFDNFNNALDRATPRTPEADENFPVFSWFTENQASMSSWTHSGTQECHEAFEGRTGMPSAKLSLTNTGDPLTYGKAGVKIYTLPEKEHSVNLHIFIKNVPTSPDFGHYPIRVDVTTPSGTVLATKTVQLADFFNMCSEYQMDYFDLYFTPPSGVEQVWVTLQHEQPDASMELYVDSFSYAVWGFQRLWFAYDAMGHRSMKRKFLLPSEGSRIWFDSDYTFYVRDPSGQPLAIINRPRNGATTTEHPIYGLGRLGTYYREADKSLYELKDHLGNVRAILGKDAHGNAAALTHATDYYPGGMPMPGRQIVGGEKYRYGYQGEFAETDEETGKPAFQLRIYDPRINRWISPDPYRQYHSPYMAMGNNFMNGVDADGGCWADKEHTTACKYVDGHATDFAGNSWSMVDGVENLNTPMALQEVVVSGKGSNRYANTLFVTNPDAYAADIYNMQQSVSQAMSHGGTEFLKYLSVINPWTFAAGGVVGAAATSTKALTATRAAFNFSTKSFGSRLAYETGSELISQKGKVGEMNLLSIGASVFASNWGADILSSKYSFTINNRFEVVPNSEAILNLTVNRLNGGIHNNLGKWSKELGGQGAIKGMEIIFTGVGMTGTKLLGNEFLEN